MIDNLVAISNSHPNHNIIFPVGASHIKNISDALEAKSLSIAIDDSFNNQETVSKTSTLMSCPPFRPHFKVDNFAKESQFY